MKAFWWFKENSIAGMARPGFNSFRWLDFTFEEAVVMGWLGTFSNSSSQEHDIFLKHAYSYGLSIGKFHGINETNINQYLLRFQSEAEFNKILSHLRVKAPILKSANLSQGRIYFDFNKQLFNADIEFLKNNKINSIVTLTESPHGHEILKESFEVHHFSIEDLSTPTFEQAQQLAKIIQASQGRKMAIHCLAGIGRTSTMIMAAHMILGEDQKDIENLIKVKNTSFGLSLVQREFINKLSELLSLN